MGFAGCQLSWLGAAVFTLARPGPHRKQFFYQTPVPSTGTSVGKFVGNEFVVIGWIHEAVPWFGRASVLLGLLLLVRKIRSGLLGLRRWRRWLALGLLMLLGNGLVVNSLLKEGWGVPARSMYRRLAAPPVSRRPCLPQANVKATARLSVVMRPPALVCWLLACWAQPRPAAAGSKWDCWQAWRSA